MPFSHNTQNSFMLDTIIGKIYSLFVIKLPPLHLNSEHNGVPEEILTRFGPIFPPVTNISLNISIQFPQACEVHLLQSQGFTFPKHHSGNNDINDRTNEWGSQCCISILLLLRGEPARRRSGVLNAHAGGGSHRRAQRNTWLSYLLILEERYSQCCASARAGEPFRGRPLHTDSHY